MGSAATKGLTLHSHTGVAYRFDPGALCLELLTTGGTSNGTHLLATVARDAVELLAGLFGHRIRTCAAEDCHLV